MNQQICFFFLMTVVNSVKWINIHDIIDNDYNYECTKEYEDDDVTRRDWLMSWCWLLSVVQRYAIISSLPLLSDYYMCMMTMSGKNNSIKTFNMRNTYTYSSFETFLCFQLSYSMQLMNRYNGLEFENRIFSNLFQIYFVVEKN